jgi:hypothetical protein
MLALMTVVQKSLHQNGAMTLIIMTFGIRLMLHRVLRFYCYAERRYAECRSAEHHFQEFAVLSIVMLRVSMVRVIFIHVFNPSVTKINYNFQVETFASQQKNAVVSGKRNSA